MMQKDGGATEDTAFESSLEDDALIDSIIEEARNYSEQRKSERRAKMFSNNGAPEIFSKSDRTIRTKNQNPLDLTGEFPVKGSSAVMDDDPKNNATIRASVKMEVPDSYETAEEDFLNPDGEQKGAQRSYTRYDAVFENGESGGKAPAGQDGNLNMPEEGFEINYDGLFTPDEPNSGKAADMLIFRAEGSKHHLPAKSSVLLENIEESCREFTRLAEQKNAAQAASQREQEENRETVREVRRIKSSFMTRLMDFFSTGEEDEIDNDGQPPEEDYEQELISDYESKADAAGIFEELNFRIRSTGFKTVILTIITLLSATMAIAVNFFPQTIADAVPNAPVIYAIVNLAAMLCADVVSLSTISNGLIPLARFRGNSDTACACAAVLCTVQSIAALFASEDFFSGIYSYYTVVVLAALLANIIGKRTMVKRIKENFKFLTSKRPNYAIDYIKEDRLSREMASGTAASDPLIAYQSKREFLTDFLKNSYAQDKCEIVCARLAPVTLICSLVLGIVYGVIKSSFIGAISMCAVIAAVSVPVCGLLVVNLPLKRFSRDLLQKNAMITGFPAAVKFSKTNCVTVDAYELYAKGVTLQGLNGFEGSRGDEAFLAMYAALKAAKSPIVFAFSDFMRKYKVSDLPGVDSWIYEDGLGIVAWVKNERVIIGTREIMEKYGVYIPSGTLEESSVSKLATTFVAFAGELCATLLLKYTPQRAMFTELRRAELNGISVLVSCTDCNITQQRIASDFCVYYRSVKVLSSGHTSVERDKACENRPRSKAYIVTKGGGASMLRAVSGCQKLLSAFSVGIVLQTVCVILGVVLTAALGLFASVSALSEIRLMIYIAFWIVAVLLAQLIHRP